MATAPKTVDDIGAPAQIRMSDIRAKFPMYQDLSDEQLLSGLRRKFYADVPLGDFYARIDMDTERDRLQREAAESGSWLDRARANVGAGFANVGQGIQQLAAKVGIGDGPSDEDIQTKRDMDQRLADATRGGKLLQIAGEAAPTFVIPGGVLAGGAARAATRAGPLGRAVAAALRTPGAARTVTDSALQGVIGGALGPVKSDESRLANAAIGGTLGAVLPGALLALRAGGRAITRKGGQDAAARLLQDEAIDVGRSVAELGQYNANPGRIPLSGAAAAGDEGLARLEAGARVRNAPAFYADDQARAAAVSDAVRDATSAADDLATRRSARAQGWTSDWANAAGNTDDAAFRSLMQQLGPSLEAAARSPEASNPAVRGVIDAIQGEIERVGLDNFTPAHLQQLRANLNARGKAIPQNAWQAAPRDSAMVNSLIDEFDSILNQSTGDAWQNVLSNYAANSRLVDQSKAAGRVRQAFWDDTGRVRGTAADALGDVPSITEAGLGRAMDAARQQGATVASPAQQQGLSQTLEALRRQGLVQRVKKSGSAGGGSDTASNTVASQVIDAATPGGWIRQGIGAVRDLANRRRDEALVEALRDPAQLQALLTRAARQPGTLTPAEQAIVRAIVQSGAAAASE